MPNDDPNLEFYVTYCKQDIDFPPNSTKVKLSLKFKIPPKVSCNRISIVVIQHIG